MELPYDPVIPLVGIYSKKTLTWKDTCIPMFILALVTITKTWNNLKVHRQMNGQRRHGDVVYMYNDIIVIKRMKYKAISHNMNEARDYCTKWSRSYREREIYDITYIWNLRNDTNELIYKTEMTQKHRKQTFMITNWE